jgi:hypothetical protein
VPSFAVPLPFADQIAAPARPHPRGVYCPGRHVTTFAGAIRVAGAIHRQSHLPTQNDVRGFRDMRVIGVRCVRPILPHIRLAKSFLLKASREFHFVHNLILTPATSP